MRILIADDHVGFRQAVRQMLESSGNLQVCGEASNGQEAIQQALQLGPDLIVLDIAMPVTDGLTAAKQIKTVLPNVPILMLSSFGEMAEQAQHVGAQGFILKTQVADSLLEAVHKLLEGKTFFDSHGR